MTGRSLPALTVMVGAMLAAPAAASQARAVQWTECDRPEPAAAQTARPATLDDFLGAPRLDGLEISPDGETVLLSKGAAGPHNVYTARTDFWFLDVGTGACRRLDAGEDVNISQPGWSPDSRSIVFVNATPQKQQVRLADLKTGEVNDLVGYETADAKLGTVSLTAPRFSPDGAKVGYFVTYIKNIEPGAEPGQGDSAKVVVAAAGSGVFRPVTGDRFIEVVSPETAIRERVTAALSPAVADFSWSPDSARVALVPLGNEPQNRGYWRADPAVIELATKEMRPAADTPLSDHQVLWSPDGERLAFLTDVPYSPYPLSRIRSLLLTSIHSGEAQKISGEDISIRHRQPLAWSARAREIYAIVNDRATLRVRAFSLAGKGERWVTPASFHVTDYALSRDGRTMAAIFENAGTPAEVYVGDPVSGEFRRLTDFGAYWEDIALAQVERMTWRSRDDRFDVEGWLFKPRGYVAGRRYPALFHLHGGPGGLYVNGFLETRFITGYHTPAELYAAAGYWVLLVNVRGDEGYGDEFVKAFAGNAGRGDVESDFFGAVDAMVSRGLADPERLGVLGHSYGAFAAAWAIARTERFRAASLSDGLYDWWLFYNQTYLKDENWTDWFHFLLGCTPLECQREYLERSPTIHADRITTPTLIRVGAVGLSAMGKGRSPSFIHAKLMFRSLHQRSVPVEFVVEPTQNHVVMDEEVYRDWVTRNLDWFDFWLNGREHDDPDREERYARWRRMESAAGN